MSASDAKCNNTRYTQRQNTCVGKWCELQQHAIHSTSEHLCRQVMWSATTRLDTLDVRTLASLCLQVMRSATTRTALNVRTLVSVSDAKCNNTRYTQRQNTCVGKCCEVQQHDWIHLTSEHCGRRWAFYYLFTVVTQCILKQSWSLLLVHIAANGKQPACDNYYNRRNKA